MGVGRAWSAWLLSLRSWGTLGDQAGPSPVWGWGWGMGAELGHAPPPGLVCYGTLLDLWAPGQGIRGQLGDFLEKTGRVPQAVQGMKGTGAGGCGSSDPGLPPLTSP